MALILKEMTPELATVVEIARDIWWLDRRQRDEGDRLLMAALARAFPEHITTQENCPCGDPCEECVSQAFVDGEIAHLRKIMEGMGL